jgi:hypothetical protein
MAILAGNNFNVKDFAPALWLDAADSNTLYDATTGGALVAAGGAVARWEDKSGNGRHATQATLANRPTRTVGAQNTRDSITFNGSNNRLEFARFDMTAVTFFIAVRRTGSGTYQSPFQVIQASTTRTAIELGLNNNSSYGPLIIGSDGNGTTYGKGGTLGQDVTRVITGKWLGGSTNGAVNYEMLVNGQAISLTNSAVVGAAAGTSSLIGAVFSGGFITSFFSGYICELIILPYAATDAQRQSIERYLANKWGLGFNPLSLSPALWLDASDSNTLYDATTGGALVGAGGAVARWEDKSGNARHATQATLDNRPLRTAAVQGGKDALTFDGSNDFMATPAFGGTQDCTYFLVTASKNATQNKVFAAHANNYANPPLGANYVAVNAARLETAQNGASGTTKFTGKLAASQNLQNNIFRIAGVQFTSTNAGHIQRVNGVAHTTTNAYPQDPGVFTKAAQSFGVGAYNTGGLPCHCDIAELIYFTKLLTASERQAVERYLAQKWNIIT